MHIAFQDSKFQADVNMIILFSWAASLTCSSDKMRVIINKSYLESLKYNENNLQLNDPTCRPKVSNVVEFSIPLDECGTIKKVKWNTDSWVLLNAKGMLGNADSVVLADCFNEQLPNLGDLTHGKHMWTYKSTHSFTHKCQIIAFIFRVTRGWLSFPKGKEL